MRQPTKRLRDSRKNSMFCPPSCGERQPEQPALPSPQAIRTCRTCRIHRKPGPLGRVFSSLCDKSVPLVARNSGLYRRTKTCNRTRASKSAHVTLANCTLTRSRHPIGACSDLEKLTEYPLFYWHLLWATMPPPMTWPCMDSPLLHSIAILGRMRPAIGMSWETNWQDLLWRGKFCSAVP